VECFINGERDVAEMMRMLGSATAVGEHMFTDKRVRVKIVEVDGDAGERLVAIVENEGVVRRGGVVEMLSSGTLSDLKRLIEAHCGSP
jgi:hypothetical protein